MRLTASGLAREASVAPPETAWAWAADHLSSSVSTVCWCSSGGMPVTTPARSTRLL